MFWEARVSHEDYMASPSKLVLGNDCSDGGDVGIVHRKIEHKKIKEHGFFESLKVNRTL